MRAQQTLSEQQLAEFRQEVAILKQVYHPNVVLFLGCCFEPGRVMIVTQYMPRGSLDALLKSDTPLAFDERLRMAKDIALGLSWLHNISKIVHRCATSAWSQCALIDSRRCGSRRLASGAAI